MGNSTKSVQSVVDYARTVPDLSPVLPAGGFATEPALTIASDVMAELLAARFNWKFNRLNVPPFYTNSWQQDYLTVNQTGLGWLEHAVALDINSPQLPKPIMWLEAVRDLQRTSFMFGSPQGGQVCWLYNDQLAVSAWPGAGKVYTNPVGAIQTPTNPPTCIADANGNLLLLTTYGTTGGTAPVLAAASVPPATVADGSCVWSVCAPKAQGFRLSWLPPQQGVVQQLNVVAQMRPPAITSLSQKIDPIPDEYAVWFRDGFIAYCHRHSANPAVRQRFAEQRRYWLAAMEGATKQGDRERDAAMIVPGSSVMQQGTAGPIGPAWPFGQNGGRG